MANSLLHSSGLPDAQRVQDVRRTNNLSPNLQVIKGIKGQFFPEGWNLSTPIQYVRYELDVDVPEGFGFLVPHYLMFETDFARRRGQAYQDESMRQEVQKGTTGSNNEPLVLYIKPPEGIPSEQLAQCTVEIYIEYFKLPPLLGECVSFFNVGIPYQMTSPLGLTGGCLTSSQAEVFRSDGTGIRFQMPYWPAPRKRKLFLAWD